MFIKILIHHLETIDGKRGSAKLFKELLVKNEVKKLKRDGKKDISDEEMN